MAGHVFITYSHHDGGGYVGRLATFLANAGIPVWFDKEIDKGDRWTRVISQQLDSCAVVVVIMTPDADQSDWVDIEIMRALQLKKTVLPLLLSGECFFTLSNVQYEDVRSATMPGARFMARLRACLSQDAQSPSANGDVDTRVPRDIVAEKVRVLGRDHPDTLASRRAVAIHVGESGKHLEAVRLLRSLVFDQELALGVDHSETLASRHQLGYHLGEAGERSEAAWRLRDVVGDRTRVLGADHVDTLISRHAYACNVGEAGDAAEAVRLLREIVTARTRILGTNHPHTLASKQKLGHYRQLAGA